MSENKNLPYLFSKNQIIKISEIDGVRAGVYRILDVSEQLDSLVLFLHSSTKKIRRPFRFLTSNFTEHSDSTVEILPEPKLESYMLKSLSSPQSENAKKAAQRYQLIAELVETPSFLFELTESNRSKLIVNHALKRSQNAETLRRYLTLYWHYGQRPEALTPAYENSGGVNVPKRSGTKKLGRPVAEGLSVFDFNAGKNVSPEDKTLFDRYLQKYYFKARPMPIVKIYEKLIKDHYQESVLGSETAPSLGQFRYWTKKTIDPVLAAKKQSQGKDYERNKRSLTKSVTHLASYPGFVFEIDATVCDVYVVSEFNRQLPIGRPTVYSIVDRASRVIVGLHVSHLYASWRAARNALVNMALDKQAYCKSLGIDINHEDWPAAHLPMSLICDRGEMIGLQPESLVVPLIDLKVAPSYRGDMKSIVEGRFKVFNDDLLHELEGSTGGSVVKQRGLPDPKTSALYTINDIRKMLISDVIAHNNRRFDELALSSPLVIENDLDFTPNKYWLIHEQKARHGLRKVDEIDLRASLLPKSSASVTKNGIKHGELYYSCEKAEQENWFSRARIKGRWKVDVRSHDEDVTFIFLWDEDSRSYKVCELLERSKLFKHKTIVDVYYFQDWKKHKKLQGRITSKDIETASLVKSLTREAKRLKNAVEDRPTRTEKGRDLKMRRREELAHIGREDSTEYLKLEDTSVTEVAPLVQAKVSTSVSTADGFSASQTTLQQSPSADKNFRNVRSRHSISLLKKQQEEGS